MTYFFRETHLNTFQDYELYYNGCCNATFWPLFHSMPDRAVFEETYWVAYRNINQKFALKTIDAITRMQKVFLSLL